MSDTSGFLPDENIAPFGNTGVYPSQMLERLLKTRSIFSHPDVEQDQIQPASLDLRLGRKAYRVGASFLPGTGVKVMERVAQLGPLHEIDISNGAVLEKKSIYVVELLEALDLEAEVYGVANPKSSTGRLDILTRLITDGASEFDRVPPGYTGRLYLEVAPLSFGIFVRPGDRLSQLRLQRGIAPMRQNRMSELYRAGQLTGGVDDVQPLRNRELVPVTVDLLGSGEGSIVAYKARKATNVIDLNLINHYDPSHFWTEIHAGSGRLHLEENAFYILATREDVGVPPQLAAEMVPYDSRSGEFRVHYAGFFDPGFGMIGDKAVGSKAVLEVRSHGVPFTLEHKQIVGWLRYAPVANGFPTKLYGVGVSSNYQGQGLRLAKQFKRWTRSAVAEQASEPPLLPEQFF